MKLTPPLQGLRRRGIVPGTPTERCRALAAPSAPRPNAGEATWPSARRPHQWSEPQRRPAAGRRHGVDSSTSAWSPPPCCTSQPARGRTNPVRAAKPEDTTASRWCWHAAIFGADPGMSRPSSTKVGTGGTARKVRNVNIFAPYRDRHRRRHQAARPLKIVVDSATRRRCSAPEIFRAMAAKCRDVQRGDGNFPNHHPDPAGGEPARPDREA